LPHERLAIGLGHPVLGLDAHVGVDAFLERALLGPELLQRAQALGARFDHLRVHRGHLQGPERYQLTTGGPGVKTIHFVDHERIFGITSRRLGGTGKRAPGPDADVARWIGRALATAPPRAKSLVVTVWGDAIAPHGGSVWLAGLIRLLAP